MSRFKNLPITTFSEIHNLLFDVILHQLFDISHQSLSLQLYTNLSHQQTSYATGLRGFISDPLSATQQSLDSFHAFFYIRVFFNK